MTRWKLPTPYLLEGTKGTTAAPPDHTDAIERTLSQHRAPGRVVSRVVAPQLTRYAVQPGEGILPARIERLADALSVATSGRVRYAGIDGGHLILEVPSPERATVSLRRAIEESKALVALGFPLGVTTRGTVPVVHLATLPHLLIAGTTGSGKSGMLNSLLVSLLMRNTPAELRFVMIDPKRVELSPYEGLPHLDGPVIDDMLDASRTLEDVVEIMEQRYALLARAEVKNLHAYNDTARERLPRLVVVVDELADLLATNKENAGILTRLAQKGRAAGIHLVLATQRPSKAVLPPSLVDNIPGKVSFAVADHSASKVAIGSSGAEKLTGKGDGLFVAPGEELRRFQAPWVTEEEIERIVMHWSAQAPAEAPQKPREAPKPAPRPDAAERAARDALAARVAAAADVVDGDPLEVVHEAGISDEVVEAIAEVAAGKIMKHLEHLLEQTKGA